MNELAMTLKLKTIFPTLNDFKTYINEYINTSGDFLIFILPYIYNFYVNSNINYDTDEAFKRQFIITFMNVVKRFEREHKIIEQVYNIQDDEINIISRVTSVIANNDNSVITDPLSTVLEYVSAQDVTQQTRNKLDAFYGAIDKLSNDIIETFINELRKHFVAILYDPFYLYKQ